MKRKLGTFFSYILSGEWGEKLTIVTQVRKRWKAKPAVQTIFGKLKHCEEGVFGEVNSARNHTSPANSTFVFFFLLHRTKDAAISIKQARNTKS